MKEALTAQGVMLTAKQRPFALGLGFLGLVYGLVFLSSSRQQQCLPREVVSNTVFQLPTVALANLTVTVPNTTHSTTTAHPDPPRSSKPKIPPLPLPAETGCFPYLKGLRVEHVPEHECDKPYITMNESGRLGNKMFQYASLYLLRHLFGVRVSTLDQMFTELNTSFANIVMPHKKQGCFVGNPKGISYMGLYDKLYKAAAQVWTNTTSNLITESLLDDSYYVGDYPEPRDLFLEHRKLLHSIFKFRDEVKENAIQNINNALQRFNATYHKRNFPIVTVHVRRTDYKRHMKIIHNLTQLGTLYFTNAFEFYKKRLKRPVFLVVSDDPDWCRQYLQAKDVLVIASDVPAQDMAVMSLGDHHVTSYGTFSFMGALLGSGNITHPLTTNPRYQLMKCVDSPIVFAVARSEKQEYDEER